MDDLYTIPEIHLREKFRVTSRNSLHDGKSRDKRTTSLTPSLPDFLNDGVLVCHLELIHCLR